MDSRKKRILLVDDESFTLHTLRRMLMEFRHEWDVQEQSDPFAALEMLKTEPFDAAVVDVMMPGLNGLDLLKELQADPLGSRVQVIILTGLEDQDLKRQALDLGATDLLNKPIERENLIARLRNAIRIKDYADELLQANEDLQVQLIQSQKVELVGVLSAGVVHDLKNIMSIIGGYSYILSTLAADNQEILDPLSKIKDAVSNASKVMLQILSFSKPEQASREQTNLSELIEHNMPLFKPLLTKGVKVHWLKPERDLIISGVEGQLTQVLMNLIINAGQAMEHRGELMVEAGEARLDDGQIERLRLHSERDYAVISITDTGPGMDEETAANIFQPHFTTKGAKGGFGLGLMVVKWIVENNQGAIEVDSQIGRGTTFRLYFPIEQMQV